MSLTLSTEVSPDSVSEVSGASPDYAGNTLRILHRALIRLRVLACQGTDPKTIGRMLDDIEYLGVLAIQSRTDDSPQHVEDFRLHLQDLEAKYEGFGHLTVAFDGWQGQSKISPERQ